MNTSFNISDFLLSPEYVLTKANLNYFQPSLLSRSKELFVSIKKQQKEFRDPSQFHAPHITYQKRGSEAVLELVKKGPVIFVSFHMGPIGPLLSYISNHEIDFKLLFDQVHFEKWAERYLSMYREYTQKNGLKHLFEVLNVEEEQGGLNIADAMRSGSSLLLYIDGNTGSGGVNRQDSKLCNVDFFGKKIFARKGAAHFSRLFNAPIIPVTSYFEKQGEEMNYFLEFSDPVFPDRSVPKKQLIEDVTQQLYSILEKYVLIYPDQWEGWLYFHNFIDKSQIPLEEIEVSPDDKFLPLRFNDNRFSFIFHEGDYFLFDRVNYRQSVISEDVYKLLSSLQTLRVIAENIDGGSIIQLLKMGVLTAS